ncbi:MAG: hypothetical protein DIU63_02155 [Proteobacteria bacterium]|jgi:hypothetical protein|nr:MAG: hypothetical protein DIU63_02155 [Pseudomonadota bacterium]
MPHLICLALLLVLGTGAAVAGQAVVVPVSCESRDGRLVVYPTRPNPLEIVSELNRQVFSACHPSNTNWCRPIMLYKFDVACGGERVAWRDLAAAVLASSGTRAWVDKDRLHITPPRKSRLGDCGAGDPGFTKDCDPWELGDSRNHWVLPVGFAPVHEVGARFVPYSPADTSKPPVASAPADFETGAILPTEPPDTQDEIETVEAQIETDASPRLDIVNESADAPSAPAPVRVFRSEAGGAAAPADANEPANPARIISSPEFVQEVSAALAAAQAAEKPRGEEQENTGTPPNENAPALGEFSASSIIERYRPLLSWLWEQGAASVRPLTAQFERLPLERNVAFALVGAVLLSGLVSGIGLYSLRSRRVRATAYRSAGLGPEFGAAPQYRSSSVATSQFGAPAGQRQAQANEAPSGNALVDPTDERMCGELCRTAHAMLQQIDARVDELQGVAPLRRVLQREMRHLEQFLTAVMTANPREPEEWRRMRNRLQRIVRELHRLRDIVEGAYRSLSVGGFTSREPPRDKYEAYEMLGVNPDVSLRTLKKLVDALRACWHPDLAKDEADRLLREERMKRINIAWDLITEKRQEA